MDMGHGKRLSSHSYLFDTAAEVKQQITWEQSRVCGNGFFGFNNYTREPHEFFIEPEWAVSKT